MGPTSTPASTRSWSTDLAAQLAGSVRDVRPAPVAPPVLHAHRRARGGHDADGAVVLENRELDLCDRLEAVLANRGLEVVRVEALPLDRCVDPCSVPGNHGGFVVEDPPDER